MSFYEFKNQIQNIIENGRETLADMMEPDQTAIKIKWEGAQEGWRVHGYGISFMVPNYATAFFFKKYEDQIDSDFMFDYLMND